MKTISFLTGYWHINLAVLIVIILLVIFHFYSNGRRFARNSIQFFCGIGLLIIATFSPLDYLSKNMLFSAHMTQHILALLVIPPLLLAGTSKEFMTRLCEKKVFRRIAVVIFHPVFAWIMGVGSMWISHAPGLMMSMQESEVIMDIQTIALLVLGFVFIWPVFTPVTLKKLDPLQSSLYLFLACVGCTALGILITFAPSGLFTSKMTDMNMGMDMNIITMIRTKWGITMDTDQQVGGLIMWVPACLIYLSYVLITLFRWLSEQSPVEKKENHINPEEKVV